MQYAIITMHHLCVLHFQTEDHDDGDNDDNDD